MCNNCVVRAWHENRCTETICDEAVLEVENYTIVALENFLKNEVEKEFERYFLNFIQGDDGKKIFLVKIA